MLKKWYQESVINYTKSCSIELGASDAGRGGGGGDWGEDVAG